MNTIPQYKDFAASYRRYLVLLLLGFGLLTGPLTGYGARYALLVGVGDYPINDLDLEGPRNDVVALEQVLIDHWDFSKANIEILLDAQATKRAVLDALRGLLKRSAPGDELFFYYSGHGTSARDESVQLPLPDNTAGLLPHDVVLNRSKEEIVSSLIVGRSDLRPIFRDIDQSDRQLLVMIDACYSGNAVRGFSLPGAKMPIRYVPLDLKVDSLLPDSEGIKTRGVAATASEQAYPYENVFFIAASGEYEEAADISGIYLKKFPTIDGKAHGAFSDAMLRMLSGVTEGVDADGNQRVSHLEAKQGIESWMAGKFPQTPQHLPPSEEDRTNLASRSMFGVGETPQVLQVAKAEPIAVAQPSVKLETQSQIATSIPVTDQPIAQQGQNDGSVRIALDPSTQYLAAPLSALPGAALTDVYPDLRVLRTDQGLELRTGANDLIIRFEPGQDSDLVNRIGREVSMRRFLSEMVTSRAFELSLDVAGKQNNGPHIGGEMVRFSVRTDLNAWLLLLNVDREGGINVLFPVYQHEQREQPKSLVLQTPEIEVVPPFGSEQIVAVGFRDLPGELFQWLGELPPRIEPDSEDSTRLFQLIRQYQSGSATRALSFITVP